MQVGGLVFFVSRKQPVSLFKLFLSALKEEKLPFPMYYYYFFFVHTCQQELHSLPPTFLHRQYVLNDFTGSQV